MSMSNMHFDLCIRGGTLITASERFQADIGIRDGRILMLGRELSRAERDIDATGLLVMPGGVDAHCHIEEPAYQGAMLADDFDSATRAAACGGTTTIMPFVNRLEGASMRESAEDYAGRASARARIDYAFHMIFGESSIASTSSLVSSFKPKGVSWVRSPPRDSGALALALALAADDGLRGPVGFARCLLPEGRVQPQGLPAPVPRGHHDKQRGADPVE